MMYLFQLSIALLGFFIGCWLFGVTKLFIEDAELRKKITVNTIIITFLFSVFFFLNL